MWACPMHKYCRRASLVPQPGEATIAPTTFPWHVGAVASKSGLRTGPATAVGAVSAPAIAQGRPARTRICGSARRPRTGAGDTHRAVKHLELGAATGMDGSIHFQLFQLYRRLGNNEKSQHARARALALRNSHAEQDEQ